MKSIYISILCVIALFSPVEAKIKRSKKAVTLFKAYNACPATQQIQKRCDGYIVDHIIPLCAEGVDDPSNMQWQTIADAKLKDKDERKQCAFIRKNTR